MSGKNYFEEDSFEITIEDDNFRELEEKIHKYFWNRFCDFLILREHSEWEAKEYLKRINTPYRLIDKFVEIAIAKNYLNEERFVEMFIRSKISKKKSKDEIKSLLYSKKVSPKLIEKYLNSMYSDSDEDKILKINFEKALKKYGNLDDKRKRKEKIINFMMRKGFNYSKIKELLELETEYFF